MSKRVFLSFLVLLALLVSFVPSAARAAEHIPYSVIVNNSYRSTLGEYSYRLLPGERYSKYMTNQQAIGAYSTLPISYHYYPSAYDGCYICHSDDYSYSCYVDDDKDGYVYCLDCTSCNTHIKSLTYYEDGEWYIFTTGVVGSPFIGSVSVFISGIMGFFKRFASFIVANWFTFVLVALPLIGVGITLVIRLVKKNK